MERWDQATNSTCMNPGNGNGNWFQIFGISDFTLQTPKVNCHRLFLIRSVFSQFAGQLLRWLQNVDAVASQEEITKALEVFYTNSCLHTTLHRSISRVTLIAHTSGKINRVHFASH